MPLPSSSSSKQANKPLTMEETLKKQLLNSNSQPPDEDKEQICWPYCYQIEVLKDDLEEMEESHHRLTREYKDKTRAHDLLTRDYKKLQEDNRMLQEMLHQRDKLIDEHGLILINLNPEADATEISSSSTSVQDEDSGFSSNTNRRIVTTNRSNGPATDAFSSSRPSSSSEVNTVNSRITDNHHNASLFSGPTLISRDIILLLESFEGNNLEDKLKCMAEEREDLLREIQRLKLHLEDERRQNEERSSSKVVLSSDHKHQSASNPVKGSHESQSESSHPSSPDADVKKMLHEYKFKLKRAEQEILVLQGNQSRLESQLTRYKSQCEELEKTEEDLKVEKRKILRELREFQTKCDELETQNSHLQKRIHKLKENRVASLISSATASGTSSPSNGPSSLVPSSSLPQSSYPSSSPSNFANNNHHQGNYD